MANIPLNLQFLKEMQVKKQNITVHLSYDPGFSGYGGYDEWTVWDVPGDQNFAQSLQNFLEAYAQGRKIECTWEGAE